jgi:curved DNA-binding protein CbpA
MTYADLQQALTVFNLSDRATLADIRSRHRELVKRFHPDGGLTPDPERIRQVNTAHEILTAYCRQYRFSFTEAEFYEQNPEERLRRQFEGDPLWGNR